MSRYFAPSALLPQGWARDVTIEVDLQGDIASVVADSPHEGSSHLPGPVVPGMPNVHSHAFQRVLAGRAERGGDGNFWRWRDTMYAVVDRLDPDDFEAIATFAYLEMLKAGYTSVGEFHYVHHGPGGRRYDAPAEMASRVLAAADSTGIGVTLLPVLYAHAGFGGRPPSERQRRFTMEADEFCALWDSLAPQFAGNPRRALGVAPHSLRAVSPEQLRTVVEHVHSHDVGAPIHIHIAEQQAEVEECLAWSGARPVAWLLEHAPVDESWCLVHATHVDAVERTAAAKSAAVAGLCPTTEANLGDGIFPAAAWMEDGGRIGIGSDSQVTIDPAEELRWLEYGQRLLERRRAVLCDAKNPSVGGRLFRAALSGGAQALGRRIGAIAPGFRADLVVLDSTDPSLAGAEGDDLLDGYVFGGAKSAVRDVMVGGRWVIAAGRCTHEPGVRRDFAAAARRLLDGPAAR